MQKVLWISDTPANAEAGKFVSGMGRVTAEFCKRLNKDFQVIVGGWHYDGSQLPFNFPVIRIEKGTDQNAYNSLSHAIKMVQPDILVLFGDYFYFPFTTALKQEFPHLRIVGYINVDSQPLSYSLVPSLKCFDKIICSTKWGMELISDLDPTLKPSYVYHGTDFDVFKPLENAEFNGIIKNSDQFIVLFNQQNTVRHNPATAMEGFSRFAQGKDDVIMIMNTNGLDSCGHNLFEIVKNLPNNNKIMIAQNQSIMNCLPDSELNKLYNVASCYISTSTAEGVGLGVLESMACKLPVLATNYSSLSEILDEGRGFLINTNNGMYGQHGGKMMFADVEDVSRKLNEIYNLWKNKPEKLEAIKEKAYEWVTKYSWDEVYKDLYKEVVDAFNKKPMSIEHVALPIDLQLRENTKQMLKKLAPKKKKIGVMILGGLGDNLMITPLCKAIKKKYPDCFLATFTIDNGVLYEGNKDVDVAIEIGNKERNQSMKSVYDLFDLFYDVRGMTKVFGEEPTEFYKQNEWFYDKTNISYSHFYRLNTHFIDMILKSAGYEGTVTKNDMFIAAQEYPYIPKGKYVVLVNSGGVLGEMKKLSLVNAKLLVEKLRNAGIWTVQTGTAEETYIDGCVDMRGMLTINQLAYVIKKSSGYVGMEGGIAHIARAVNKHGVVYFGNTAMEVYAYPENINLSTKWDDPCYWRGGDWHNVCMYPDIKQCKNIPSVDEIYGAVLDIVVSNS